MTRGMFRLSDRYGVGVECPKDGVYDSKASLLYSVINVAGSEYGDAASFQRFCN